MKQKSMQKNTSRVIKKAGIGLLILIGLVGIGAGIFWFTMPAAQRNMISFMLFSGKEYSSYKEYQVIARNKKSIHPSGAQLIEAESEDGDFNVNVATVTEMVKNNTSAMLKKGMVQTNGVAEYTGWQVLADEGASETAYPYGPSPLSYYTAGIAANLHTQIIRTAELEDVVLDSVKVEVCNNFRWNNMLEANGTGHLDLTTVRVIIESSASEEVIENITTAAFQAWSVGEALLHKTAVEPNLIIRGENWNYYGAEPGTAQSDKSFDGDRLLSSITEIPRKPNYIQLSEVKEENSFIDFDAFSNMEFQIYAISETATDITRPYLKKITISTPTPETWEIYSDEFMSNEDTPVAPTSLEYFTIGTSLCLTSQTTLVSAMMGLEYEDYRVEHMFEYSQEHVNTANMIGTTDLVHSYVFIASDEPVEKLELFFNKSLALCFAGEGLVNETEMDIQVFLNGDVME